MNWQSLLSTGRNVVGFGRAAEGSIPNKNNLIDDQIKAIRQMQDQVKNGWICETLARGSVPEKAWQEIISQVQSGEAFENTRASLFREIVEGDESLVKAYQGQLLGRIGVLGRQRVQAEYGDVGLDGMRTAGL